jgi:dihydrofolate reductase
MPVRLCGGGVSECPGRGLGGKRKFRASALTADGPGDRFESGGPLTKRAYGGCEVIYYVASSLDGRIATPDGGVRWLEPFENAGEEYGYARFYSSVDALLLGRRTYAQVRTFGAWPFADKPCWVFSRRKREVETPESALCTGGSPRDVVAQLRSRGLRRAWLVGGGALAASFRAAGLITEYIITYVPVVLGAGIELFGGAGPEQSLRIVSHRAYPNGVVQVRCVPERAARRRR